MTRPVWEKRYQLIVFDEAAARSISSGPLCTIEVFEDISKVEEDERDMMVMTATLRRGCMTDSHKVIEVLTRAFNNENARFVEGGPSDNDNSKEPLQ